MPPVSIRDLLQNNLPIGYTGSQGSLGFTGSIGFTGSASTVPGFTGSVGASIKILGLLALITDLPDEGLNFDNEPLIVNDSYVVEEDGNIYVWNGTEFINSGRIQGYTGSFGFTGSRGEQGPAGGFTGSRGDTGFVGSKGDLGFTGSQGPIGFTGSQGIQGIVGFRGSQGFTGSAGTGLDNWTVVTENYLATDGNRIIADTSAGSFVIVLPISPPVGAYVVLTDGNDWGLNPIVVSSNGASIEGFTEDLTIDVAGISIEFIWDGTQWQITATIGSAGVGVPEGGTTGQVLAKISDDDYDTAWVSTAALSVSRYVNLSIIGEIAPPTTGVARFYPVVPIIITKVNASVSLPPQGGPFTFSLLKNGVDIGAVFSIPAGSYRMTAVLTSIALQPSEYLTVNTSGSGSRDLHLKMEYI